MACWSSSLIRPARGTTQRSTRSRRVIVVCHSGTRAALAGRTLQELGFTDVALMEGGMAAWQDAGLPIVEHEFADI